MSTEAKTKTESKSDVWSKPNQVVTTGGWDPSKPGKTTLELKLEKAKAEVARLERELKGDAPINSLQPAEASVDKAIVPPTPPKTLVASKV